MKKYSMMNMMNIVNHMVSKNGQSKIPKYSNIQMLSDYELHSYLLPDGGNPLPPPAPQVGRTAGPIK